MVFERNGYRPALAVMQAESRNCGRDRAERRSGDREPDAEPVLPGFRWKVRDPFAIRRP